jgi:uncharacterized membrane protein YhfC
MGMLTVGLGAMALWYLLKRPKLRYFAYGAILWAVAIIPKYIMDFTITQPIQSILLRDLSATAVLAAMSLYVGLRTGLFESGFTYLAVKYTKLSRMGFNEAMALGLGFGGIEAIFVGILSLLTIATLMAQPVLAIFLPPEQLAISFIPVPILERLFTLFCHVFATLLAVYAVKLNDLRWLALSILFKTALDGALLPLQHAFGTGLSGIYIVEGYVAVLGIIALAGIYWFAKKYSGGVPDAHKAGDPDPGH